MAPAGFEPTTPAIQCDKRYPSGPVLSFSDPSMWLESEKWAIPPYTLTNLV